MPGTYTWGDVMAHVGQFANRNFETGFAAMVADRAQSTLWNAADWKETIADLPPFFLVPQEQDYGPPVALIPADFKGFRQAYMVVTINNPPVRFPLTIDRFLQLTEINGQINAISYERSLRKFRVFPRPSANLCSPWYVVDGNYKQKPTKLTPANYANTPLPWDDQYFDTVVAVAQLKFYDLTKDFQKFQNQWPITEYLVQKMMADEALNTGDQMISPNGILQLGWYGTLTF